MDIIEKARELGKLIQQEESYIALQKAQADADADMEYGASEPYRRFLYEENVYQQRGI